MTSHPTSGGSLIVTRLAWIAVAILTALLTLGTLITTYRVGMVDPIWPTEPWFLLNNWHEPSAGYLIEHIHRVAGYLAGLAILATVLAAWHKAPIFVGWIPLLLISVGIAISMTSIDRIKARVDPIGAFARKSQTETERTGTCYSDFIVRCGLPRHDHICNFFVL